jgi:putative beta-lysine N-acetyltransferase
MTDIIENIGNSLIQHGKHSDRIYLMKLSQRDLPDLIPQLDELALSHGYTKIFAKVPETSEWQFRKHGFRTEATVPDFFRGRDDVTFMGKYFVAERVTEPHPQRVRQVLEVARSKEEEAAPEAFAGELSCRRLLPADCEAMAELYREVFASYPFPIHEPDYLKQTMTSHVIYLGIYAGPRLVAIASAELDRENRNAEMTDFATLPEQRGRGLANRLLAELEQVAAAEGIRTAYTIARAYSFGMNITFAKNGYQYAGTLTRNTQISGELESMNVWFKPLTEATDSCQ